MNNLLELAIRAYRRFSASWTASRIASIDAQDRLAAKQLDELQLRDDEGELLGASCHALGRSPRRHLRLPIYAYSKRYKDRLFGVTAGSIPVRR